MSASQADPPSNDRRRTAAISPPSQHSASNVYSFGQATSNPPISHHQAYMPVNQAGMAGRHSYGSPGATMPANIQASAASESDPYSLFSNQRDPSRDTSLSYNYISAEPPPIYFTDPVARPFPTMESLQQGSLEQNNETQGNIQSQGLFNPTPLHHNGPFPGPDLAHLRSGGPRLFPRVSSSSAMPNNDSPLNSLSLQFMPEDYHNTQFSSRGSPDNEGPNGPIPRNTSHPIGAFPTDNPSNVSNSSSRRRPLQGTSPRSPPSMGNLDPNTTTTSRRRPRRTNNNGMPGSMPRGDQRQPQRHHTASAINIGILGGTLTAARDQSYVNAQLARLLYAGALVRYPNATDGFLTAYERERRRRFRESLTRNNPEPVTPVKGLDCAEDGRPEPKETEELTVNLECKVCMSQLIDTVVLPCGHAVLCRWFGYISHKYP
ncbi:hypothetical protein I7I51_04478 [Histoplasma capsulatum]|uniref:RING-type domain-containing protein n=1 Tax=Ajellomyces capsulatus TaxID=5037 RepID=A0A8A1M8K1_AJECA|nr:hypothetical protein I7I51_04478 [Histoplasma capsulatum]